MGAHPSTMLVPLPPTPNSSIFESGMVREEKLLTWKINNFGAVLNSNQQIDSQTIDFQAGDTIGRSSRWGLSLIRRQVGGEDWVGISLRLKLRPSATCQELPVQCLISVNDRNGESLWSEGRTVIDAFRTFGWELEFPTLARKNYYPNGLLVDRDLIIEVFFVMYAPLELTHKLHTQSLEEMVEEFQIQSRDKARKDLAGLLQKQVAGGGSDHIKIVSSEGLEVTVQKCFLMARNPVFNAMLENDMLEANSGLINLPDISFAALQVLLHFFYTGDLLQEWSSSEVIAELTNAAAKYQIDDLLRFLDLTLVRVCNLQNVASLLILANQLELKKAEKGLLDFMQKNGLASTKNFMQVMESMELALGVNDPSKSVVKRIQEGNEEEDDEAPEKKRSKVEM